MKAILVEKPFEVTIAEVADPVIESADQVKVRIISGGICGSDVGIYNGTNSLATYPRIIGHEFGGEVVEVGADVTNVKVGDMVALDPVRSCGDCYACNHDRHNVCNTVEVVGVHRDGGFAEYVVSPAADVYKLDTEKVSPELIALVEPYSIGMQVNYRADIAKGDNVLVMGSGPIGLAVMQIAKSRGAYVMMTDVNDKSLERALDMGADKTINVMKENLEDVVNEVTDNYGMNVVVDGVCNVKSVPQALSLAGAAGRVVTLGLIDKPSEIAQVEFTKKELTVVGSRLNNYRFPEVIELFESGAVTPEKMVSHKFHYTDIQDALDVKRDNPEDVCKIILTF